jgi:hypothetical protein
MGIFGDGPELWELHGEVAEVEYASEPAILLAD